MTVPRDIEALVAAVSEAAMRDGADAVALVGSWARGDPRPRSDVDITVLGREASGRLEWRDGQLVSISFRSIATIRADFEDPGVAGVAVPTWTGAELVSDPTGVAAALKADARRWTWARIGDERLNAWVAESITGYAEEVLKLRGALERGDTLLAGVMRSVLAIRLAPILAVHRRLLFHSEDATWGGVLIDAGEDRRVAQERALAGSADAAIELFRLAVAEVAGILDERQRRVVQGAIGQVT